MIDYKDALSALAIGLTFLGFLPYIRQIKRGSTQPHLFSWLIWGSTTFVVFLAQLQDGGGAGAWPIGVSGIITLYIALLAYQRKADTSITPSDWVCLALALSALPLWAITANPLWAVIILTTVDMLGFGPTLRKSYHQPHSESLLFFSLFALRNLLAIGALSHYSLTTVLFPAVTGLGCVVLLGVVGFRRWMMDDG